MRAEKIGIIMEKNRIRDKIIINLQKTGHKVYVIPEDEDILDIIKRMSLSLILLGKSKDKAPLQYVEEIKTDKSITDIPIITMVDRSMGSSNIVKILEKGAMDIVYIKDDNPEPVLEVVQKFLNENKAKFEMKIRQVEDVIVINIDGELDIINSMKVQSKFREIIDDGKKNFIIDLGNMNYIESVGLGVLIFVQKSVNELDGKAKFIIKSQRIKKIFSMVKLNKYFDIYEDINEIMILPSEKEDKIKVAVIDDTKFMRRLISEVLKSEGFETIEFSNPVIACEELQHTEIDIILVDFEMPEMNGIEFIERFKPKERQIPTIMLTTLKDINLALNALRLGASDFLNKPFEKEELIHIIRKIDRENKLVRENKRLFLELKRREEELEKKNRELSELYNNLEEELEMASEIQQNLLPQKFPEIGGYKFAVKYQPSQDIGGDYYDIIEMSNGYYGVAFADISGHGIPAALLSTMFKVYLMAYSVDIISPAEAMEILNEIAAENFPEGKFISLFYLVISPLNNRIKYCKAAQEPALLMSEDGEITELVTKGQVLGLFSMNDFPELVNYEEEEVELKPGEKIFLYTDGIIEAQNKKEEFYGLDRLKKVLKENRDKPEQELIDIVYGDLLDFLEGLPVLDDLTLMVIEKE